MRVGLVSLWFNRGQATVMRTIRAALDELGHETHVLARPTDSSFERPSFIADDSVWAQEWGSPDRSVRRCASSAGRLRLGVAGH